MDCVNSLEVDTEDCLELCEGTIADVVKLDSTKNEDGLKTIIEEYEKFKFSQSGNLSQPHKMRLGNTIS